MIEKEANKKTEKSAIAEQEEKIIEFWNKENIFQKSLEKDAPKGDFVFFEGPPTANGKPGIHHVEARAFKDLIPRFKTMNGFRVQRKAGWDTHGLPVEIEVEKKLGLKGKKDVENYGVEEFNKQCKKSVWEYKEDWEKMTERIGFWVDMKNPYITYDSNYIESLWWIIKQAHEKNLLYKGYKVVPNCPRCGTALSSHEVAQGYRNIKENSVYIKFKIKGKSDEYILAWTTTPWTLPGNIALAVGVDIDYVKIKQNNEFLILAKNLLNKLEGDYEIIKEFKGTDLIGLEYEPLFTGVVSENVPNAKNAFKVYPADFVSTDDGTGVVHTAVMYGVDDYELGEKIGLPKVHTVNLDGTFNELLPKWQGRFVKDVEKEIITDLEERNILYKTEMYAHDYPFCWRCGTPLIYFAKDSWYFKMSALREDLIKNNETINWIPNNIKEGRFGEWLRDVKDWAISRERYWGTPIPVWECQTTNCKHMVVVGGYDELEKLSGKKIEDPHKPYIDEIKIKCEKCGSEMKRVPDVMDCWFDSGSMPFAQSHYPFENRELIDSGKLFPADFISEGVDQTRGWFYTLLAVSTILGKGASYKNVISLGHLLDKNGKKMSKSLGNVVNPIEMIDKYGVDTLRWYLYTVNQPGDPILFDEVSLKKSGKVFTTLANVLSFYKMFSNGGEIEKNDIENVENILDKWIIGKMNLLIKNVTKNLEEYNITTSARDIDDFIMDLSQWYVRRSRDRFKGEDEKDKENAKKTLGWVLLNTSKLIAPFAPFFAESVYKELGTKNKESVHLENYPEANEKWIDEKMFELMKDTRRIISVGLEGRMSKNIKVRQPLQSLKFGKKSLSGKDEYLELIKDEVNVKEVLFSAKGGSASGGYESNEDWVELNTELTEELIQEGIMRDLLRQIQDMRKTKGLVPQDIVEIEIVTNEDGKNIIKKFENVIKKTAGLKEIKFVEKLDIEVIKIGDLDFQFKIL
ncbi:MAG: isoleucyl-tRNA synthetase [Parcubacteria group bacterium Athens0714_16]|nr:MAG: isoleucyl-tRNA synthetase [Parcubacteria group bacterium Athens0714_16]